MDRDWIWVAISTRTVFFNFSTTRGFEALRAILPEDFARVLCAPTAAPPTKMLKDAIRQFCWAHFHRKIIAISEANIFGFSLRCMGDQPVRPQASWEEAVPKGMDRRLKYRKPSHSGPEELLLMTKVWLESPEAQTLEMFGY